MARPPNILVVLSDSSRADIHGCYGSRQCRTPHADRLAREGAKFENAYCASPICHPSRAAIETGLFPHANGMIANRCGRGAHPFQVHDGIPSYADLLAAAGYRCGYAGQIHHRVSGYHDVTGRWQPYYDRLKAAGRSERPLADHPGVNLFGRQALAVEETRDYWFLQNAMELLERYARLDQPWLIECEFDGPHPPFWVPEPYASLYEPATVPRPANFEDPMQDKPYVHRRHRWTQGCEQWSWAQWQRIIAHYWGFQTMLDDFLGRLLTRLDELRLADNTVVLYTTDHGELVGAHGVFTKYAMAWDECMRVPLIVRGPGFGRGEVRRDFVSHVDMLPTLCAVAGAKLPERTHGRSLTTPAMREDVMGQYHGDGVQFYSMRMLRTERWKYVWHIYGGDELYDLAADPGELRNVAGEKPMVAGLAQMKRRLWRWMERVDDPLRFQRELTPYRE